MANAPVNGHQAAHKQDGQFDLNGNGDGHRDGTAHQTSPDDDLFAAETEVA